jgi:hypothetical protein
MQVFAYDTSIIPQTAPFMVSVSGNLHDVRGRFLGRRYRLRQGRTGHPCSQKCGSQSHIFVNKIKRVPCCRRRFRLLGRAPGRNWQDRVTPVIYTTYAVVDPTGDSASGRAEETNSKCTMLPQANRASTWAHVQFVDPPRKSGNFRPFRGGLHEW